MASPKFYVRVALSVVFMGFGISIYFFGSDDSQKNVGLMIAAFVFSSWTPTGSTKGKKIMKAFLSKNGIATPDVPALEGVNVDNTAASAGDEDPAPMMDDEGDEDE